MIRTAVAFFSILTAAVLACSNSAAYGQETEEAVPFETLIQSGGYFVVAEPVYVVLRNEFEEVNFLNSYPRGTFYTSSGGPYVRPFPQVNYRHNIVIGIALGLGDSNTVMTVDSVVAEIHHLVVYTTEHDPCVQRRVHSNPAHFVAVARRDQEVIFAPTEVVEEPCRR